MIVVEREPELFLLKTLLNFGRSGMQRHRRPVSLAVAVGCCRARSAGQCEHVARERAGAGLEFVHLAFPTQFAGRRLSVPRRYDHLDWLRVPRRRIARRLLEGAPHIVVGNAVPGIAVVFGDAHEREFPFLRRRPRPLELQHAHVASVATGVAESFLQHGLEKIQSIAAADILEIKRCDRRLPTHRLNPGGRLSQHRAHGQRSAVAIRGLEPEPAIRVRRQIDYLAGHDVRVGQVDDFDLELRSGQARIAQGAEHEQIGLQLMAHAQRSGGVDHAAACQFEFVESAVEFLPLHPHVAGLGADGRGWNSHPRRQN